MSVHSLGQTRRQVLSGLAGAALSPLAAQHSDYRPVLAAQFYVWTQQFDKEKKTIAQGVEEAFAATSRAGYRHVELMSQFFTPELKDKTIGLLHRHKLDAPIVYNGGPMHEPTGADKTIEQTLRMSEAVKDAGTVGISFNPSPKPERARKTDAELETQARSLDRLGRELRSRGFKLLVHQHDPELMENAREWKYQYQHTDPKLVSFMVDVHWALRGGQDPVAFVRDALPRTLGLHLRNSVKGIWLEELADGEIDYRVIAAMLKKARFSGYLSVELAYEKGTQITRTLEDDLRRSRIYAEKVFGLKKS